jgi:hypothetical protein
MGGARRWAARRQGLRVNEQHPGPPSIPTSRRDSRKPGFGVVDAHDSGGVDEALRGGRIDQRTIEPQDAAEATVVTQTTPPRRGALSAAPNWR